ncbi:Mismatch repair endonuclease pms2 [Mortierella sp. AM989]|nr:Mismatch repair endonuclease pms2 [Mortierella sp. AM989]
MTTASSSNNNIKAIDKESVHRICSGQVVLDMATAVKELLENSLDAGATSINIKFKQNGLEGIVVTDNGCGITDANLETLGESLLFATNFLYDWLSAPDNTYLTHKHFVMEALKHYTSKLRSFNDLAQVTSFGFRGEALSSLCALSILTVTTSTGLSPIGVMVEYTSDGIIKSKTPTPMTKGTTVQISNLFEGMPVRRSEFVKNIKREYSKCIGLIQAYALIVPNVRISCVSQMDKKPAMTQIATSGNTSIRQNIINVFGPKAMADIIDFELRLIEGSSGSSSEKDSTSERAAHNGDEADEEDELNQKGDIILTGYISSPAFGKGRSSTDRQYVYINGRPCTLPKIARVINEVYRSFNTNQSPFLVANLVLPTSYYDVNVSPDKRTIFLHNERMIVEELRTKLTELFEPSRSTFAVSEARQLIKKPDLSSRLKSSSTGSSVSSRDTAEDAESDDMEDDASMSDIRNRSNRSTGALAETTKLSSLSISRSAVSESTPKTVVRLEQTTLLDRLRPVIREPVLKRKANITNSESEDESASGDGSSSAALSTGKTMETSAVNTSPDVKEPAETVPLSSSLSDNHGYTVTLQDVMEEYDPLDDRTPEGEESSSDSEVNRSDGSFQRSARPQRIVVLDSEIHYDGDREWIEVGFEMEEQKRRRTCRMASIQKNRRLEQERSDARKERLRLKLDAGRQNASSAEFSGDNDKESVDKASDDEKDQKQAGSSRRSRRLRSQKLSDASFANMDDAKAQKTLSRVISKDDFATMKILGQFNKAFIVARLDKYATIDDSQDGNKPLGDAQVAQRKRKRNALISSDIFVIDQHASDEKYNFETLQAKTVFSTQRLFQPKKLYLTAQEEITVVEHMKMLNKNGFYLDYDPEAAVSHRLKLVTLPVSEKVVFDLQDFEELVFLLSQQTALPTSDADDRLQRKESDLVDNDDDHYLHEHNHIQQNNGSAQETMVRCSKVRALFASRACRRSVMIGHVLNHSQMKRIVRHMGEIDQPWNCPHGRPTMRHLLDLAELEQQEQRSRFGADGSGVGDDDKEGAKSGDMIDQETDLLELTVDRVAAFDPIALKRPTRHQGSLFSRFMAIPPRQN